MVDVQDRELRRRAALVAASPSRFGSIADGFKPRQRARRRCPPSVLSTCRLRAKVCLDPATRIGGARRRLHPSLPCRLWLTSLPPTPACIAAALANMSQPVSQWQWDPRSRRWYMHDVQRQVYIFEDGERVSAVPRGQPPASQQPASAADLSTSPTGRNAAYGISHGSAPTSSHQGATSSAAPSRSTTSASARRQETVSPDPLVQDFAPMTLRDNPRPRATNEEREFTDAQGRQYLEVRDPGNQVRTTIQIGPADNIPTDPGLLQQGIRATQMLIGSAGDTEQLFEGFRRRGSPRRFFTLGKVFRVLWSEPAGDTRALVTFEPGISTARFGERVHSKVRLFVVIREGDTYCSALSIVSYSHQGVAKRGVKKSEHGIVHSGRTAPEASEAEAPQRGEEPMRSDAIRINPDDQADPLHPMSRIDYGKVYTIQVSYFGRTYHARSQQAQGALVAALSDFRNLRLRGVALIENAARSAAAV